MTPNQLNRFRFNPSPSVENRGGEQVFAKCWPALPPGFQFGPSIRSRLNPPRSIISPTFARCRDPIKSEPRSQSLVRPSVISRQPSVPHNFAAFRPRFVVAWRLNEKIAALGVKCNNSRRITTNFTDSNSSRLEEAYFDRFFHENFKFSIDREITERDSLIVCAVTFPWALFLKQRGRVRSL